MPWHACPCCVGNIPAHAADDADLDCTRKSRRHLREPVRRQHRARSRTSPGTNVEMVQKTDYPWDGKVAITVNPARAKSFTIRVRVPNRDVSSLYTSTPDAERHSRHSRSTAARHAEDRERLRGDHAHVEARAIGSSSSCRWRRSAFTRATRSQPPAARSRCATDRWSTTSRKSIRTSTKSLAPAAKLTVGFAQGPARRRGCHHRHIRRWLTDAGDSELRAHEPESAARAASATRPPRGSPPRAAAADVDCLDPRAIEARNHSRWTFCTDTDV